MNKELFVETTEQEVVIALTEEKNLVELYRIQNDNKFSVGDVFLGKVKRIMPGLNAAFVDIGASKDAFLHYLDLGPKIHVFNQFVEKTVAGKPSNHQESFKEKEQDDVAGKIQKDGNIANVLKPNQYILVQITKENISTKGARVTSDISFPGRFLVLIPFSNKIYVSQKIGSPEERNRLKHLIQSIKPKNYGVIIRTVAENQSSAELNADLTSLVRNFEQIKSKIAHTKSPKKVLDEQDKSVTILRDFLNKDFSNIVVNDEASYNEIKEYIAKIAPDRKKIVKRYEGEMPMFEYYNIHKQIRSSFGKVVPFSKKGAYMVIEHTEALHVIDINSGRRVNQEQDQEANALSVNLDAAKAVAHQLRLRDIGGIIVVDFIDMHNQQNRKLLFDTLVAEMANDKAKHTILPPTAFGLVQITRQRVRTQTNLEIADTCPMCNGHGQVPSHELLIYEVEKHIDELIHLHGHKKLTIVVNPYIYHILSKGWWHSYIRQWRKKYGKNIFLRSSSSMKYNTFQFLNAEDVEIVISR